MFPSPFRSVTATTGTPSMRRAVAALAALLAAGVLTRPLAGQVQPRPPAGTPAGTPAATGAEPSVARAPGSLLLGAVYRTAERQSPRSEAARALARAAFARVPGARRPPDPQLQLGFMNYDLPGLKPMDQLGMNQLQLMQMVPVAGKLGLSGDVAGAQASAQAFRARDVSWEVRTRAAAAF